MTTKRTHGPCTCGQKHADPTVSCAPECASLYPAQQEPDALTRLGREIRALDSLIGSGGVDVLLSLISEAREEQRQEKDAEITRLRAALKPFAELARTYKTETGELGKPDDKPLFGLNDTRITVGDLRAALKALEET